MQIPPEKYALAVRLPRYISSLGYSLHALAARNFSHTRRIRVIIPRREAIRAIADAGREAESLVAARSITLAYYHREIARELHRVCSSSNENVRRFRHESREDRSHLYRHRYRTRGMLIAGKRR